MRLAGSYAVSPPDPGDQWAYYNTMASQVGWGGELLAPPVNFGMGACTASLKGSDDVYGQRCPDPWVNIDAQPGALTARAIFPRDYYEFLRKYVAFALPLESAPV